MVVLRINVPVEFSFLYTTRSSLDLHSNNPRSTRNVWSAAFPQAKSEVTGWSAQMYTAFVGVRCSWPGWNALRCCPI